MSPPSLQINSTPFGGNLSTIIDANAATNNNNNTTHKNPFNESGFCDMNDSTNFNNMKILPDLNALANNSNKLDCLLDDNNLTSGTSPITNNGANMNTNSIMGGGGGNIAGNINNNKINQSSGGFSMPSAAIFNPFSNKTGSALLNARHTSNYDALRNSPELESMQQNASGMNMLSSSPIIINNTKLSSDKSSASSASSFDMFKDAASQAFSELNPDSNSMSKIAYEFSNKMAGANFGFKQKV